MKSTRQSSNEFYGNVILGDSISDAHSVTGSLNVSGSTSVTGSITATNIIKTINTTNSTTWTNGAMVVDGGVGIGKDTWISGSLNVIGNLNVLGSSSIINLTSSQLVVEDNIITVNGYSPYLRYAGIEAIDSGSAVTASLLWDGQGDYWMMVSSSNQSSRLLGTTYGTFGSETSLTTGYIPKITGANTLANGVLFQSASNIGLGTTTPVNTLHVVGSGMFYADVDWIGIGVGEYAALSGGMSWRNVLHRLDITTDSYAYPIAIGRTDAGYGGLYIAGTTSNVGIGTQTPGTDKLRVEGNGPVIRLNATTSSSNLAQLKLSWSGSDVHGLTIGYSAVSAESFIDAVYPRSAGTVYGDIRFRRNVASTMTDVMVLKGDTGYVGMGTTTPATLLHIKGTGNPTTLTIEDTVADASLQLKSVRTLNQIGSIDFNALNSAAAYVNYGRINCHVTDGTSGSEDADIRFATKGAGGAITERMTIQSGGNVGIGTSSPSSKLHVSGTISSSKMILDNGDLNNPTLVFAGSTSTGLYYDNGIRPNATFYTRDVIPGVNNGFDLGSNSFKYRTLYLSSSLVTSTIHNNGSTLTISGSTVVSGSFTVAYPSNGTAILKSYATADGSYKAGDFWVLGDLYVGPGSSKYFIANNPDGITSKTDSVKYVAIEGPSKSVFNHGKGFIKNKSIEIDLPPEWNWLVDDTTISVTLTSINKYAKLTYEIKNNKLVVYNKSWFKRNVNFSYQLIADRKDVEKLKVYDEFPLQS